MASDTLKFALSIYSSAETYDGVVEVFNTPDGVLVFETVSGRRGFVERNSSGDWDVWVGMDLMSVIEDDVFAMLVQQERDLFKDLANIKRLMRRRVSGKTLSFLSSMHQAIEKVISDAPDRIVPKLNGKTIIGIDEYIYVNGKKMKYGLN